MLNFYQSLAFTIEIDSLINVAGTLQLVIYKGFSTVKVSRHSVRVGSGITRLSWLGGSRDLVLAATLEGLVRIVDIRRGDVRADCSGHSAAVLDMAAAM